MRIALGVEYNGSGYSGFQWLPHADTIQEKLERALSRIADHPIRVHCAGRTDAGVHADEQVIHFETDAIRADKAWTLGVNQYLPPEIRVLWAKPVDDRFHARFSAKSRRYHYKILNRPIASALLYQRILHHPYPLDEKKMHEAAKVLIGEQDFSSFRAAECQSRHPFREIFSIEVSRVDSVITVDIHANAFLHHMVRNIVGSLLLVGDGRRPLSFIESALHAKDRRAAGPTAPPYGLYFHRVYYDEIHIPLLLQGAGLSQSIF